VSTDLGGSLEWARRVALTILGEVRQPTPADLDNAIAGAIAAGSIQGLTIDAGALHRRLSGDIAVFVGASAVLDDPDADHRPWLDACRGRVDFWRFWEAYRDHMARNVPDRVVRSLDRFTDDILGRLEDPHREGPWDTRGMVVGSVQSGKTSNYTGLICKAADAGYNFIVVLAGLHNSLRSQTQARLDEGFLGLDSRPAVTGSQTSAIGVGAGGRRHPAVTTLTSSEERGDFSVAVASRLASRIDERSPPVLLVVKKNRIILENLINWVTQNNGRVDPDTGRVVVRGFPLLVIDDEADNASVNTKDDDPGGDEETDPTTINRLIRTLLNSFERSALVSYTATPFANIFIDGELPHTAYGEDLFPRSFIIQLPPPTNYIGPARVFGIPAAEDPEGIGDPGLAVIRVLADNEAWLVTGHRKDAVPAAIPPSLREALRAFILVCAARAARGQVGVHNSMLIHVTRFVDVQREVSEQVQDEVDSLRQRISGGDADLLAELEGLWTDDFLATTAAVEPALRGGEITWRDVRAQLPGAAGRIRVMEINGSARDALTYSDHPDGISVIAIGGDKLSRGLTLEGLSVSYYLRASKMYDTLMQMGRWFGYRPGYGDLIRIYTTGELVAAYRDITIAAEELNGKFREMARVGSKPTRFALYVRSSPAGLLVTAPAKMRSGRKMFVSFSEDVIETIGFPADTGLQRGNARAVELLLRAETAAGSAFPPAGHRHRWGPVRGEQIAIMLDSWHSGARAQKARGPLLAQFIRDRIRHHDLTDWTIILISSSAATHVVEFADLDVGLTVRAPYDGRGPRQEPPPGADYNIKRLGDQRIETLDLDADEQRRAEHAQSTQHEAAIARAIERGEDPSLVRRPAIGPLARQIRPPSRGLLVLYLLDPAGTTLEGIVEYVPGFLVSFPRIEGARGIEYVIPRRYWSQEAG
jgi:Z1 domain